jgi:uncharacterized glyoxalase superfamily protein PhnB
VDSQRIAHRTITPYLVMDRCAEAIEFHRTVFGATEVFRTTLPDGAIGHAEPVIGDSLMMVADAHPKRYAALRHEPVAARFQRVDRVGRLP